VSFARASDPTPPDQQAQNLCTLRFDCDGIQSVSIRDLSQDKQARINKELQEGILRLPQGEYSISHILFQCGLEVSFKHKIVYLMPDNETVISFNKPMENSLIVKKQGVFFLIEYNPKAYWDEEFYFNKSNPPVFRCYKGDRLIYSGTFEYG
jgi:predicted transcriptional regulator